MWSRMPRGRIVAIAVVATAVFTLGNASTARSTSSGSTKATMPVISVPLQGSGWIFFSLPAGVDPARTTQHLVQGAIDRTGACVFANSATANPGFGGHEDDEIAFNSTSCQAVVASGPIQATALPDDSPPIRAAPNSCIGSPLGLGPNCYGGPTKAAYLKTWWTDPPGYVVTSLRDDVEWGYNGSCDVAYTATHKETHLWETGWILDYQDNYTHLSCGAAISNSDAKEENGTFPLCSAVLDTAYTHYNYNHEAVGKPDGSAIWAWNDYADSTLGICYRYLNWHDEYNYEALF